MDKMRAWAVSTLIEMILFLIRPKDRYNIPK